MFVGTVKVKLSKSFKWEGREVSIVELDFGKVTAAIINQAERDALGDGNVAILRHLSSDYCGRLAASISGLPFRAIEKLPFYDFEKIWQTVAAFVNHRNPQKFYDQFTADDDVEDEGEDEPGFTEPAEEPEKGTAEKLKEKPAAK
jgi:hypothetical protein